MKALLLAGAVLTAVGCASEPSAAVRVPAPKTSPEADPQPSASGEPPTTSAPTTTEAPTTTTTTEPEPVTTRRTTTTARQTQLAPVVHDGDFWYRLAMCESGAGAGSPNVFQFQGGTAEKVGYYPGASYAEQVAMAQDWAARIHPREGSTAGWPVCWAVATAGGR